MPSYNLHERLGVSFRRAAIDVGEDVVSNVLRRLSPRTRLVAVSHVSRHSDGCFQSPNWRRSFGGGVSGFC